MLVICLGVSYACNMCYNVDNMSRRLILILCLMASIVVLLMLNFTTPSEVGPLGVLVFFTMIYIVMFGLAQGVVRLFVGVLDRKMRLREYLYGAVIAMGPIVLLLIKSLGYLNLLTMGVTVVALFLACFLIKKRV